MTFDTATARLLDRFAREKRDETRLHRAIERAVEKRMARTLAAPRAHRREMAPLPRTVDTAKGTAIVVISREVVARDGMLLRLAGLDLSEWERAGGPVIVSHEYGDPTKTIGRCIRTWLDGDKLMGEIVFARQQSPLADQCFNLLVAGVARSFSIGWTITEQVTRLSPPAILATLTPTERNMLTTGQAQAIVTRARMTELSMVALGADTFALAL